MSDRQCQALMAAILLSGDPTYGEANFPAEVCDDAIRIWEGIGEHWASAPAERLGAAADYQRAIRGGRRTTLP